ncbi:hypothetical protein CLU79DRAFT_763864 [Phycomyces nitens]|nr:hypothetical protein CLU79DRAFT_763864 [Phycomyces nitens]
MTNSQGSRNGALETMSNYNTKEKESYLHRSHAIVILIFLHVGPEGWDARWTCDIFLWILSQNRVFFLLLLLLLLLFL